MVRRMYSGNAPSTTLSSGVNSATLSIPVTSVTGYPNGASGPFFIVIDPGLAAEEKVLIDSISGSAFVVNASGRGADGTSAASHSILAVVQHVFTKTDADEANEHINDDAQDHHSQYHTAARFVTAHDVEARHAFGAALGDPGAPADVGIAAAAGTGDDAAREDHVHAIPAAWPRGVLGRTLHTVDYPLTGSASDIVTLTVTTVAGRRYKLSASLQVYIDNAAAYGAHLRLVEGATIFRNTFVENANFTTVDLGVHLEAIIEPSAASHTYKVTGFADPSTAGNQTILSGTGADGFILIEDIGAA